MTSHTYKRPHPAVTVDIVIFTIQDQLLRTLLVRRGVEPYLGEWALPGGFVKIDESLQDAARRELEEETGVRNTYLDQLGAMGAPDRDPRERVITIAYTAIIPSEKVQLASGSDAAEARWFDFSNLPKLAFDHAEIVELAHTFLVDKLRRSTIALQFLPKEFTLTELQGIHETILGESVDKRNFRKWINNLEYIKSTGHKRIGGKHRPAELYRAVGGAPVKSAPELPQRTRETGAGDRDALEAAYQEGFQAGIDHSASEITAAFKKMIS